MALAQRAVKESKACKLLYSVLYREGLCEI